MNRTGVCRRKPIAGRRCARCHAAVAEGVACPCGSVATYRGSRLAWPPVIPGLVEPAFLLGDLPAMSGLPVLAEEVPMRRPARRIGHRKGAE